ncbi:MULTISPECIES: BtpA/SgcQ family protein [unclassified Haloferax]|uniref:BtpA/SgcQ family protein n=1 Tax=Haloferax sp. Atlit-48N TaxID=2077198 RepID=A0ACD5I0X1_9EURY|nr:MULTISPECIES: BtpA/SgcQ family protein [unclassified Haloferax]RDZ30369.1 phosphorybosylanthranilate isomerase [Haloferax sp. Atlit-48N]RDZ34003.1 phosphorybosylanthranilate isomerase [Haloferax sp. Atlit-24N]RDZ35675.1 phosphorybosylanthranilate isomerase [Haloferax sp. Atlit-47N]RLM33608.1 phosphorybosylanthranilate isomerase [Haloferax sp. Atlit-109R]RLM40813.1 phosphorybosylanthranilate isomerase [Haloferax sp. Atlit-105R]
MDFFSTETPIIGMVHLPPLPGSPGFDGDRDALRTRLLEDAAALEAGGVDGIMLENFGDAPFYPDRVPRHVVADVAALASTLREHVTVPFGVNILRNDVQSALGIAAATDGAFVRVNVHTGARLTDQGVIEGMAHETVRLRDQLDTDVAILADIDVKHSAPLADRSHAEVVGELIERGGADGLIVSGTGTGEAVDTTVLEDVVTARDARGLDAPVLIGSGVTPETAPELLSVADGAIVGTALKEGDKTTNPVDEAAVERLVASVR